MKTWTKTLAVAAMVLIPSIFAEGAKGGATALVGTRPVVSGKAATGMSCASCKSVGGRAVTEIGKGRSATIQVEKHACPSCKTVLGVEGHGKAKRDVVKHNCSEAGAACCKS